MCSLASYVFNHSISSAQKIAISHNQTSISYEDLWKRSLYVASQLNIQKGDVVLQVLERGIEMMIGIVAISIKGGVYCPFHPKDPLQRLQFIQETTNSFVILTTNELVEFVQNIKNVYQVYSFEYKKEENYLLREEVITMNCENYLPEDLVYLISTSGTTGKPKLVSISQSSLTNLSKGLQTTLGWNSSDRILQLARCSFDAHIPEIYTALEVGATIISISPHWAFDIRYLIDSIVKQEVTVLFMVPSLIPSVVKVAKQRATNSFLPHIRSLITGGEPMIKDVVNQLSEIVDKNAITIAYGPTECTVFSTFFPFKDQDLQEYKEYKEYPHFPLGSPLPQYKCGIFDEEENQVPLGSIGEIYISGNGLMTGYYNNQELTNKAFTFIHGKKWYKTGDLGREITDNVYYHEGRKDFQIKLNGQRLELGEIESVIRNVHHDITNVVVVKKVVLNSDNLVAYIETTDKELIVKCKEACKQHLSVYMVPKYIVQLDTFPLTVNGKIDRKSLPDPEITF
jgi:amino acid adenylation domain-containing protein